MIVVDNASSDGSVEVLKSQYPNVELIANQTNVGFARANNQALPRLRGRYVLLLNTDAFVSPDTLSKTVSFMDANSKCGVLGVKLVGRDGSLQPSCRYFPTPWNLFLASTGVARFFPRARLVDDMSWDHKSVRECDWVPGCYYLVRREVIDAGRPFRSSLFSLLRGGGPLPKAPQGWMERDLLSFHRGNAHWWGKRSIRRVSNKCWATDLATFRSRVNCFTFESIMDC